jgi:cytidyltransferase-like protein
MTPDSVIPTHAEIQDRHVMSFGTFDIFHPGHIYYISEAEKLAGSLTIVIARDARVERLK